MKRRSELSGFFRRMSGLPAALLLLCCCMAAIFLGGCGSGDDGYKAPPGTTEYVITEFYGTAEAGRDYIRKSKNKSLCKDGRLDNDRHIHLYVTEEQRKIWVDEAEKSMKEIEEKASKRGVSYQYSMNYTELTVSAPPGSDIKGMATVLHQGLFDAELYQVFSGTPDWHLHLVVTNSDNGKKLVDVTQPEEGFTINASMWK